MLPGQHSPPGEAGQGEEGGLSKGDVLPGHTWEPEHESENWGRGERGRLGPGY